MRLRRSVQPRAPARGSEPRAPWAGIGRVLRTHQRSENSRANSGSTAGADRCAGDAREGLRPRPIKGQRRCHADRTGCEEIRARLNTKHGQVFAPDDNCQSSCGAGAPPPARTDADTSPRSPMSSARVRHPGMAAGALPVADIRPERISFEALCTRKFIRLNLCAASNAYCQAGLPRWQLAPPFSAPHPSPRPDRRPRLRRRYRFRPRDRFGS
jgi:hypothetical protein